MKNIARRIKSVRELKNLTQEELADNLHIPIEVLIAFEEGEKKLSQADIEDFATALEVTIDYLKRGCTKEQTGALDIEQATLENSAVTNNSNSGNTTNHFYGGGGGSDTQVQLDRIEAKLDGLNARLDFLIQAGVITTG